jgi:DNA-binding response OmpR family regulator
VQGYLSEVPSRTHFRIDWVTTYNAALRALKDGHHDGCLLDYRLGEHDGLDLLKKSIEISF